MGIRESLLNTITSVSNGDFIRVVTSAGASSKATLANVMKSFETGLGAKSSLTTSDYIRVVGSDNALYKQSVSSVKTGMGISALETSVSNLNNVTGLTDLNDAIGNNRVYYWNSNAANKPPNANYGYVFVMTEANGMNVQQIAVQRGGSDAGNMFRRGRQQQGTWGDWVKEPTRAEVDALASKTYGTITSSHTLATDQCYVIKRGNVAMLTLGMTLASDVSSYGIIASLPTGYRPDRQIWGQGINCTFDITMGGNVRLVGSKSSGQTLNITATYVVA